MIVIVEGPDLSGKTTAIEKLGKKFNSGFTLKNNFKPRTKEESELIYNHYSEILNLVAAWHMLHPSNLIILDRFYPSQQVYSILRGKDEMKQWELLDIERRCKEFNVKLIMLDTPLEELKSRHEHRGDDYIKRGQLEILKERYDKAYLQSRLEKMSVNTRNPEWLKQVEVFLKWE